jgi:membrane fusion protein, copper/silver efflux system
MKRRTLTFLAVAACLAVLAVVLWNRGGARREAPSAPAHAEASSSSAPGGSPRGQILYYRNPMGLPDTSPVPKKDAMGMDYVPVYAGEEPEAGQVRIGADKLQKLGVKTVAVGRRPLARTLRVVGTIQVDEQRESTVSAKFEGWITTLRVNVTGARVAKGQPLLEAYSPDLVSAQQDYRTARAPKPWSAAASSGCRTGTSPTRSSRRCAVAPRRAAA